MKENKNLIINAEHIDFVPNKYVEKHDGIIGNCIYVFSRKKGKTIRKRKNTCVGVVIWSKDTKDYGFATFGSVNLSQRTLEILTSFVKDINQNKIKFDSNKGEFVKWKEKSQN